jgi:hypothetical protein
MGSAHVGLHQAFPRAGGSPAARGSLLTSDGLERDLLSLYEQLLATRMELDGAVPAGGHLTMSRAEIDCVLAQLDSAIIAARHMVSSTVRAPQEPARGFDRRPARGARDGVRVIR